MADRPRLLYVVTEDWYFVSHRLELARAAREAGFEVAIATRVGDCAERIGTAGIELIPLRFMRRSSRNPMIELRAISELAAVYRRWRPAIAHHVAAKPVIYGGLAAQKAGVPAVVSALAGLGYAYASPRRRARAIRPLLLAAYRRALRHPHSRLIVQNPEDEAVVIEQGLAPAAAVRRVRGSGVDIERFAPSTEPGEPVTFVLPSRMLWDKGVGEFVAAARSLRAQGIDARFVLVGDTDPENPAAIPPPQLARWHEESVVEWWGHRSDMPDVFRSAHVVCLPSYREGLPKVLLEAAASGRPLIATDVPGCREIAIHRESALLVPARDAMSLAAAMAQLASDPALRRRLGERGRSMVLENFALECVNAQSIAIYRELLR